MKYFVIHGRKCGPHGFERDLEPTEAATISKILASKLPYIPYTTKGFALYYTTPKDAWGKASFQIHISVPDRRLKESLEEFPYAVRDRIAQLLPDVKMTMYKHVTHDCFQHSVNWYGKMSEGFRVIK